MIKPNPFYCVVSMRNSRLEIRGVTDSGKFDTYGEAADIAEKLSRKDPARYFFVLKTESSHISSIVTDHYSMRSEVKEYIPDCPDCSLDVAKGMPCDGDCSLD